jgi:DHA1 family bicyclomycin/chloramphenicol resistance-like MFS transporter
MQLNASQKRKVIILNIFVPFLMGIGIDLYVPSLPAIKHYFLVPTHLVQLTIGFYLLGYGAGQVFLGVLSDSFGRRKILLISAIFYTMVSLLAALSPNIYILNLCRLLQGLSVAGIGAVCRALPADCFTGIDLAKAMAYISTSWALGPIVGPFIGGYLQHFFNWQANFYFFAIYGLFILIYAFLTLPETNLHLQSFHPVKIYNSIKTIVTHPVFILGATLLSLVFACLVIFNVVAPFLIQTVLKFSVIAYGHMALLLGFGYFLGNFLSRFALSYFKPMQIVLFGLSSALLMSLAMICLGIFIPMNIYIIFIPVLLLLFSCGFVYPSMMAKCVGLFPKIAGTASAVFGTLTALGCFSMSIFATTLKTTSQMPMALSYFTLLLICLILFFIVHRFIASMT